jgi:hypothetical protein
MQGTVMFEMWLLMVAESYILMGAIHQDERGKQTDTLATCMYMLPMPSNSQ